jgi:RND family efflux transporter MFP subunit
MSTIPETVPVRRVWFQAGSRPSAWLLVSGLAVLCAAALAVLWPSSSLEQIPTAQVARGNVRITVVESGELRAEHQATISAPTDKQIIWLVPEGTRVKKGDLLVEFESQKYEIAKSAAESALAVARADLRKAMGELQAQRASEQGARLEYASLPDLAERGFVTRNELEAARLTYEEVKASTSSFRAGVEAAEANVQRAEREVQQQDRKLQAGQVRASRDGVVVYANTGDPGSPHKVTVGMTPFEGMELMYLPDTSSMRVDAEISEFDLAKISVGSSAALRLDAYPDTVFRGEVSSIASLARQKISRVSGQPIGVKVFDVSVKVLDEDERLKPGLTTSVEILVNENADVLYVPVAGIFVDELDRTIVYVRTEDGAVTQPVELGGSTDRVAIVLAGLEEGEQILLSPPEES